MNFKMAVENDFKYGLLGCFGEGKLCVLTCCAPCYTIGKNAEGIGEDCMLHGLLSCLCLNFSPVIRWRLRQEKNIKGTMLMDVLSHTVLPCCAMVQDAREIGWALPDAVNKAGDQVERATKKNKKKDGSTSDADQPVQAQEMSRE